VGSQLAGLIAEHEKSLSTVASNNAQGHSLLSAAQQQQLIPLNQSRYRFEYFMAKKEAAAALRMKMLNP
jgi:DNA-binding GntR family transcriptional regulator